MTIKDALLFGVEPADAEILLAYLLGKPRTWVLSHPEITLADTDEKKWNEIAAKRRSGMPVSYITGTKEFYGRTFTVNESVLIPRPATEHLVETVLAVLNNKKVEEAKEVETNISVVAKLQPDASDVLHIVDIGTGSGCIGITLALERPQMQVTLTDVSEQALNVARLNAAKFSVNERVECIRADAGECLQKVRSDFLIVSNPPYIPEDTVLMDDVYDYEPHAALFSGRDGGDVIRRLMKDAHAHPLCKGVILECRTDQVGLILPGARPI